MPTSFDPANFTNEIIYTLMGDINGTSTKVGEAYFTDNGTKMRILLSQSVGGFVQGAYPSNYYDGRNVITDPVIWTYNSISQKYDGPSGAYYTIRFIVDDSE